MMVINEDKILTAINPDIDIDENGLCVVPFGVRKIDAASFGINDTVRSKLKEVIIPDSVTAIGDSAFAHCVRLESIKLSKNLETIECFAFYGCLSLLELKLPDSVSLIERKAFSHSGLTNIVIPKNVVKLSQALFECCSELKSAEICGDNVALEGQVFRACEKLKLIKMNIPESLEDSNYIIRDVLDCPSFTSIVSLKNKDMLEKLM